MAKEFKAGLITVFVEGNIKEAKAKLGIHWRGLIIRGIRQATNKDEETITELQTKISKMADKINTDSVRIHKLENKEVKKHGKNG